VARVLEEDAESLCTGHISRGRQRRSDNEIYLNKTFLTDAIRYSLNDLQQVGVYSSIIMLNCLLLHRQISAVLQISYYYLQLTELRHRKLITMKVLNHLDPKEMSLTSLISHLILLCH